MMEKKEMGITIFMLVMLAVLFFTLGYGYAVRNEINTANTFINEFMKDNICVFQPNYGGDTIGIETIGNYNFTLPTE